jgi:hypothetical protein
MAMTIQDYQERITKCNERIKKLNDKIKKYEDRKAESYFIKDKAGWYIQDKKIIKAILTLRDLSNLIYNQSAERYSTEDMLRYYGTTEDYYKKIVTEYEDHIKNCESEIRHANEEIKSIEVTIQNYLNRIAYLEEQNSKPVIQIFKDFFNNWKEHIIEWVEPRVARYYELDSEACDLHNRRYYYIQNNVYTEEELKEKYKQLRDNLRAINTGWVTIALDTGFRRNRTEFIKKVDDYMNDRYNELVNKVTTHTGEITDVSDLRVGMDGTLNGIVKGVNGKAKIETIMAGGYNQDVIVNSKHGQCLHYRCLVHKIK